MSSCARCGRQLTMGDADELCGACPAPRWTTDPGPSLWSWARQQLARLVRGGDR